MENKRYEILESVFTIFMERIEKLNKKAKKINFPAIEVKQVQRLVKENKDGSVDVYNVIELNGGTPKLNGWEFVATLQTTTTTDNIVHAVPNKSIPERFRTSGSECNHCGHNRKRIYTYVLKHENGEYAQVGSSCLKDFLGHENPHNIAKYADWLAESTQLAEESENAERSQISIQDRYFNLKRFLEYTAQYITHVRFVSKQKALETGKRSTAEGVWNELFNKTLKEEYKIVRKIDKDSIETAENAIEWAKKLNERDDLNDYLSNLHVLSKQDIVDYRTSGLAASLITAYLKDQEMIEVRERKQKEERDSEYFGTIKERGTFKVTVLSKNYIENEYGVSTLHRMIDEHGNIAVWFSSNKELEVNEAYEIKATVKDHREFNGTKQTILTRCSAVK